VYTIKGLQLGCFFIWFCLLLFYACSKQPQLTNYGTAQLQGNVHTHPRCILHVFCMHPTCVLWQKRMWQLIFKSLLQLYREVLCLHRHISCAFQMHLVHVLDTSCMCSRHVQMLPWS